ncbi:hypothetical protein LMG28140_01718 [Paraburkholderia metrosideri]|jgi:hypothetical protein|uniref:Uncharacterized protein n=2 Tax=Paraburkholderia metrosideri TaxID=580937 RepID=A0ABN7HL38_9BURK|nr:hypothetical protein LMG28140_01718 [Paraburkholderia metrosideri]
MKSPGCSENNIDRRPDLPYLLKALEKACLVMLYEIGHSKIMSFHGVRQLREEKVTVELAETYSGFVTAARRNFFYVYYAILPACGFCCTDSRSPV